MPIDVGVTQCCLRGVRLADVSVLGEVRKALAMAYATDVSIAARVGPWPSTFGRFRRGPPDVERHDLTLKFVEQMTCNATT